MIHLHSIFLLVEMVCELIFLYLLTECLSVYPKYYLKRLTTQQEVEQRKVHLKTNIVAIKSVLSDHIASRESPTLDRGKNDKRTAFSLREVSVRWGFGVYCCLSYFVYRKCFLWTGVSLHGHWICSVIIHAVASTKHFVSL